MARVLRAPRVRENLCNVTLIAIVGALDALRALDIRLTRRVPTSPSTNSAGGGGAGQPAKDKNGNDVKSKEWLKTHLAGDRTLSQGLKVRIQSMTVGKSIVRAAVERGRRARRACGMRVERTAIGELPSHAHTRAHPAIASARDARRVDKSPGTRLRFYPLTRISATACQWWKIRARSRAPR